MNCSASWRCAGPILAQGRSWRLASREQCSIAGLAHSGDVPDVTLASGGEAHAWMWSLICYAELRIAAVTPQVDIVTVEAQYLAHPATRTRSASPKAPISTNLIVTV